MLSYSNTLLYSISILNFNEHILFAHMLAISLYCMYSITSASGCSLCIKIIIIITTVSCVVIPSVLCYPLCGATPSVVLPPPLCGVTICVFLPRCGHTHCVVFHPAWYYPPLYGLPPYLVLLLLIYFCHICVVIVGFYPLCGVTPCAVLHPVRCYPVWSYYLHGLNPLWSYPLWGFTPLLTYPLCGILHGTVT